MILTKGQSSPILNPDSRGASRSETQQNAVDARATQKTETAPNKTSNRKDSRLASTKTAAEPQNGFLAGTYAAPGQ